MSFFSSLIGPKVGLNLIRVRINSLVPFEVDQYQMVYNGLENQLYFNLKEPDGKVRKYPYDDSDGLTSTLKSMAKEKLKEGDNLDALIVNYCNSENTASFELYYTDNAGQKLKLKNNL